MYFTFLGGSALLHTLAAHPKAVAAVGIAATVTMLAGSNGPAHYLGAGQQVKAIERSMSADEVVGERISGGPRATASCVDRMSLGELERVVRHALAECGKGCSDLTPAAVIDDRELLLKAVYVSELDRKNSDPTCVIAPERLSEESVVGSR